MRESSLKIVVLLCVLLGVFAFQAFGQEATIVGTVTDPTGATVPDAKVTKCTIAVSFSAARVGRALAWNYATKSCV